MGNAPGLLFGDNWRSSPQDNCDSTTPDASAIGDHPGSPGPDDDRRVSHDVTEQHKERLSEFKLELARKHEKRRQILAEKRKEMEELREEVVRLKKENEELRDNQRATTVQCDGVSERDSEETHRLRRENEELINILREKNKLLEVSDELVDKNRELRVNVAQMQGELQDLNAQVVGFEQQRQDYNAHVVALKDVVAVSKQMLKLRESQLKELKEKVESIEKSLAERETTILSQDLRSEYERQLQNIRNLRTLYEERQRAYKREKEELVSQLDDAKKDLATEQTRNSDLEERIKALEDDNSRKYDEIKTLESNLGLSKAESRQYQAELTVINQLFSEILLGFSNSSQDIDLDKIQKHLEDHRDLLQNIVVNEISPEVSYALPKVLLELLSQVDEGQESVENDENEEVTDGKLETIKEESESQTSTFHQMNSAEEIVENLPKVWKVLIELLSHQKAPTNNLTDDQEPDDSCYKTVQTPKGPSLVLSVSQTFIRLKNLILEKKALEKETNHLKQLNGHLENRLQDQEKRLGLVQSELSKTWLVVGKLQKQHQMLHTQEKILRYELAQKRKLLTELKEELEYSREKWTQAREKNSNTEQQWRLLRTEFASRRNTVTNDNSVESGYSDDRESSGSDEEPGYETDVSECAQKASSSEEVDLSEDVKEVGTVCGASDRNDDHSVVKTGEEGSTYKTDLEVAEEEVKKEVPGSSEGETVKDEVLAESEEEKGGRPSVPPPNTGKDEDPQAALEEVEEAVENSNFQVENLPTDLSERLVASPNNTEEQETKQSPSTSNDPDKSSPISLDEVFKRRDERLKRLEGQAEQLVTQATSTVTRSEVIANRLDDLHSEYGQGETDSHDVDLGVAFAEDNQE